VVPTSYLFCFCRQVLIFCLLFLLFFGFLRSSSFGGEGLNLVQGFGIIAFFLKPVVECALIVPGFCSSSESQSVYYYYFFGIDCRCCSDRSSDFVSVFSSVV
jgi:hypothetical protein